MDESALMKKASFARIQNVNVLRLKGTPYEMGYQHGRLLPGPISLMINQTLLGTAAYVAAQTGTDPARAMAMLWQGQKAAQPFLPPEYLEEMRGIADGARAGGATVSLDQVLLWNTNYDQWCIYAHPDYWRCDAAPATEAPMAARPAGGGCSSFSAWGSWAGGDGRLIFGKNEDNFNMPGQLDNRILVVASPAQGLGHAFMTYPGMIGLDGGFNEQGIEMMTQLNSMRFETMQGCGIAIFTRLLLTRASTLEEAAALFSRYPRCAGIAYHVADARARKAAVIETSSKMVCPRYPMAGTQALWQSNHSNCYPGWMGYSGYNMVADQVPVNRLGDISDEARWQTSLRDPYNFFVQAPSRFERYRQLLHDNYGNITVDTGLKILTDHVDPFTGQARPHDFPSWTNNILCTICAQYPDFSYTAQPPVGPFKAHVANMWSMLAYPDSGDFWLAANGFPAQYGGYVHFKLKELLLG